MRRAFKYRQHLLRVVRVNDNKKSVYECLMPNTVYYNEKKCSAPFSLGGDNLKYFDQR